MKHTITNRLAALLLLVIGVMGCSKEETLPSGTPDTTRIPMTISVTDGGYAASDKSAAQSRAMENGYATTFTEGDKIGLYVVKPDGSYAHQNVALTLADSGDGTPVWTPPADKKLYYEGAEAKYFAYYPYQSTLTGNLDPSAEDAAGFFTNVVSKWTPATDQSTHALYTAQDLMIGSGTVSKQADGTCPLALTMTHAMALVVIETPTTKYTFNNDSPAIPDYYIPAPDTRFYGFTPYSPTLGTYRYLIKPAQSEAPKLIGSYKAGTTKEYEIEQNSIASANYAYYKVDGGTTTIIEKTHTLQVGDFYLKDGSLLSESVTPTDAQQAACVGIVLKVGRDLADAWKDGCEYKLKDGTTMNTIHGYVLALYDANEGNVCIWGSYGTEVGTKTAAAIGFDGYKNTNTIKTFAQKKNKTLETDFPATYYATDGYEVTHPSPDNTSGWFLPSVGQCQYWLDKKDVLLASVRKVTGKAESNWADWYLSSSELYSSPADGAWYLFFNRGNVKYDGKDLNCYVRSVLAF